MDAINDPTVHTIVVMKSAQTGWTEILGNAVGYFIDQDPCPILMVQPTLEMAQAWSKDRLAPMLRDTPALQGRVADARARDSGNTMLHKTFAGGHITIAGANSPASLASRPIRVVLCDEVDRYPASAGTEGDPVNLAKKRSTTFWNRKLLMGSTPTIKGVSRIEAAYEASNQCRFMVPCPHCDEHQSLKWKQVQWPEGRPEDAYYICEECGSVITDADKPGMLKAGRWEPQAEVDGIVGFHINELYSPWVRFGEMAEAFVEAKKMPETLKTWVNTALGETWEEQGEQIDDNLLMDRREPYEKVPDEVLCLTAFVDVQADRLEIEVAGWGEGEENWGIEYRIFWGDPTQPGVWEELDAYLGEDFETESGDRLHIAACGIDSGYLTDYVYEFVKPRQARRIFATKGVGGAGRAVVSAPSKSKTRRVQVFTIGTDEAKGIIHSRLKITIPGPGYCHFPMSYGEEFFSQLTAEKMVAKFRKGFKVIEWVKTRPRNEALDIRVGNLAMLKILNPRWSALKRVKVKEEEPEQPSPMKQQIQARRRPPRSGFVNRWRNGR